MSLARASIAASAAAVFVFSASAQCLPQWSSEFEPGDPDGEIIKMAWFDDGAGARLYAWGLFKTIGGVQTSGTARWDGQTWQAIDTPANTIISRWKVVPDAAGVPQLLALGVFAPEQTQPVYVWTGSGLTPLPSSPWSGTGRDATRFDPDGDGPSPSLLIVAGDFSRSGDPVRYAALTWNGSSWSAIPGAPGENIGWAVTTFDSDGEGPQAPSVVLGMFRGTPRLWSSNGGAFTPMTQRIADADINDLTVFDADGPGGEPGRLLAIGSNAYLTPTSPLALFDGASWTEIEGGEVIGTLVLAGPWQRDGSGKTPPVLAAAGGVTVNGERFTVATWDGTTLAFERAAQPGLSSVLVGAALPPSSQGAPGLPTLAIGHLGGVRAEGTAPISRFEVFDGQYLDMGGPPTGAPNLTPFYRPVAWGGSGGSALPSMLTLRGGPSLTSFGSVYTGPLATRDAAGWGHSLPLPFAAPDINSIVSVDIDGPGPLAPEPWATGRIPLPGHPSILRWTGSQWTPIPHARTNSSTAINAVVTFDFDGGGPNPPEFVVGGVLGTMGDAQPAVNVGNLARFDGQTWTPLGGAASLEVRDLVVIDFDGAGPAPAKLVVYRSTRDVEVWNGSGWTMLPWDSRGVVSGINVIDPDGPGPALPKLAIAGTRLRVGATDRPLWYWDGAALSPAPGFTSGDNLTGIESFDVDGPDGPEPTALYVTSGGRLPLVRRVTDTGWVGVGGELNAVPDSAKLVAVDEDGPGPNPGGLYVIGGFTRAGDTPSGYLARWGCPMESGCSADWDRNGLVNSSDVSTFINAWFVDQSEATVVTDFDHNGVVNSTDVSDFITAWFEQSGKGCG